jgi:putative transposase
MTRASRRSKKSSQLELPLRPRVKMMGRGGFREGAGRKPGAGRGFVRHTTRPTHDRVHPLHVVLRSRFRPLRGQFVFPTLRKALAKATRAREGFRIVQFSVQHDHLHLIVEASDKTTLSRGMQGLAIRVARAVNGLVGRSGKLWADRFFSRALGSPRAVQRALAYVLNNFRKHRTHDACGHNARPAQPEGAYRIDPYSSAPYFDGFRELHGHAPRDLPASRSLPLLPIGVPLPEATEEAPIVRAETWLARSGWRRAGTISFAERGRMN